MIGKSKRHLAAVGESYFEHQRFAWRYALSCLQAGALAAIHGLVPALFETAASDRVKRLAGLGRED